MGQGSSSSSSAPHIVDGEAVTLVGKSKGKGKKKKGGKKNIDMSKVKCCHLILTPPSRLSPSEAKGGGP